MHIKEDERCKEQLEEKDKEISRLKGRIDTLEAWRVQHSPAGKVKEAEESQEEG